MAVQRCVVVDTNVWAVAAGMHDAASDHCVAACLALLRRIADGLTIAVDEGDECLHEYVGTLSSGHTSGFAVKLAKRLFHTRWDVKVCKRVAITRCDEPPPSYEEIPPTLHDFDSDDQKFLAVAIAEGGSPLLFAGLDGEWWGRKVDLHGVGVNVQFLCATDLFACY